MKFLNFMMINTFIYEYAKQFILLKFKYISSGSTRDLFP